MKYFDCQVDVGGEFLEKCYGFIQFIKSLMVFEKNTRDCGALG